MNLRLFPKRDYSLDNVRFFLIFSVVFAHLLEVCTPFRWSWLIYKFIYMFHMPLFVFISGFFFDETKSVTEKVIGYIDLTEEQRGRLNSIHGIGIYIGFDFKTNPEKYCNRNNEVECTERKGWNWGETFKKFCP